MCGAVGVITNATSLGGVETLIENRAASPGEEHLPEGLIRVSVGCEHPEDLWEDLEAALSAMRRLAAPPDAGMSGNRSSSRVP